MWVVGKDSKKACTFCRRIARASEKHISRSKRNCDLKRVQDPPPETAHVGDSLKNKQGYILSELHLIQDSKTSPI